MKNKIVVLGGSSGIGKSISERFAKEGWQVIFTGSNAAKCQKALESLVGDGHLICISDVRLDSDIKKLSQLVSTEIGEIDAFVNSIGISESVPVLDSEFSKWDNSLQVMLYGSVKCTRALIPFLKDGGRIINITSIHYERVAFGSSSYGIAKAGITQFTRSLAAELAPRNILANTIAPGFIKTPMSIKGDGKDELDSEWFHENYIKNDHLPLKRAGLPSEIAGIAWFLAGPDSSYITGSVITADGGLTITF
ncbi:SDR family NAD(P)-dependent oxidoreductase [Arenibacter algicola]|jgi:3-oxoacyl-[acyl-carrier protein] reductase|uniref:3-oxoacyl-[acyl-carrier-protein] reductase FabG n=1 Tax=Arenibacter algicola TaxID=616991 RepID=A0A221UVQ7_9FLAO|nr:SDR family oxidoreductase [Arenibacter algicola]ASO05320.1 3-oxoacyl-[acyl-carrier-protein] reductase FabG [Arenibacter algicola]|tara:strand:- start:35602 stop:36354 length:753 start_codon:yes stop_codon:yes gene_type:complete